MNVEAPCFKVLPELSNSPAKVSCHRHGGAGSVRCRDARTVAYGTPGRPSQKMAHEQLRAPVWRVLGNERPAQAPAPLSFWFPPQTRLLLCSPAHSRVLRVPIPGPALCCVRAVSVTCVLRGQREVRGACELRRQLVAAFRSQVGRYLAGYGAATEIDFGARCLPRCCRRHWLLLCTT